jgi:hypothetical protein
MSRTPHEIHIRQGPLLNESWPLAAGREQSPLLGYQIRERVAYVRPLRIGLVKVAGRIAGRIAASLHLAQVFEQFAALWMDKYVASA